MGPAIGAKIGVILDERGMSHGQLAAATHLSQPSISSLIGGKTDDPSIGNVAKIARALGVSLDALLHGALPRSIEDDVRELQQELAALNRRVAPLLELAAQGATPTTGTPPRRSGKGRRAG